jgi:topoisomerase IA-like protein
MEKLLATKKTDLLQFVSARTRRPFSAFLVVQKDGKVGFEFEAKDPTKARARGGRPATALKVLGAHPKTRAPVELHSGKYGPYVKHGAVNATLPDSDKAETLTLEEALELLAAKAGKSGGGKTRRATKTPVKKAAKTTAAIPTAKPAAKRPSAKTAAKKPAAKKPAAKTPTAKKTSRT